MTLLILVGDKSPDLCIPILAKTELCNSEFVLPVQFLGSHLMYSYLQNYTFLSLICQTCVVSVCVMLLLIRKCSDISDIMMT